MESTERIARLERRLAAVERRNRWMTGACALMAVLALAGFARGHEQVVRAEKFELVNAQGAVTSQWSMERSGPVLQLGHRLQPNVRVGMPSGAGAPGLQMSGEGGRARISLELIPDVDGTGLFLFGPEMPGSGPSSGVTLLHAPRLGPSLLMQEQGRTVVRMPAQSP